MRIPASKITVFILHEPAIAARRAALSHAGGGHFSVYSFPGVRLCHGHRAGFVLCKALPCKSIIANVFGVYHFHFNYDGVGNRAGLQHFDGSVYKILAGFERLNVHRGTVNAALLNFCQRLL